MIDYQRATRFDPGGFSEETFKCLKLFWNNFARREKMQKQ